MARPSSARRWPSKWEPPTENVASAPANATLVPAGATCERCRTRLTTFVAGKKRTVEIYCAQCGALARAVVG